MPEILGSVLATPGLVWILGITLIAGVVYGFAGFGAALIFMPVVTVFIPVEVAVAAFQVSALVSLVTVVPRAWGQGDRVGVSLMIGVACLTVPAGLYLMRTTDVLAIRWAVLGVTAVTLLCLIAGWRYQARPTPLLRAGVAAATGFVGGLTGLMGPIMVLFQLSGQDSAARSRANTILFLTLSSILMLPLMALQGMLTPAAIWLGVLLLVPYGVGARIGQALFDPAREVLYRRVAYGVVGAAIVVGLPIYENGGM